jgi:hypothetical protein
VDELKSLAVLLGSVFDDVFKNSGVNVDWWGDVSLPSLSSPWGIMGNMLQL